LLTLFERLVAFGILIHFRPYGELFQVASGREREECSRRYGGKLEFGVISSEFGELNSWFFIFNFLNSELLTLNSELII